MTEQSLFDHVRTTLEERNRVSLEAQPLDRPPPEQEQWTPPIPLNEVSVPPAFPLDVLPKCLRRFAEEAAAAVPCPPDYVAVPMLVFAGAAIGASRALEIKPGRAERACLYAAVVGTPSCGKTPCRSFAARPLHEEQARLQEIYRRQLQAHEDGIDGTSTPKERTICVSDITTEKLAIVLQENLRGVALDRDELAGWVRSMDQYRGGRGADRQFWLSVWSGDPIRVHRKNQKEGSVHVAHPFVSVVGGLPPDLLEDMRGERAISDGFLDRILFSYPKEYPAVGETWASIPEDVVGQWQDCLAQLCGLEMDEDPQRGPLPRFVALTACGRVAWKQFTDELAAKRNSDSTPDYIRSALGKMNSYGARLALIIHFLRRVTGEVEVEDVDGESMDRAAQLVTYFEGHLLRVHAAMDADPRVTGALKLLRWIGGQGTCSFTRRNANRAMRGTCKRVEEIDPLLSLLEKHDYIRPKLINREGGVGRKPSPVYEVNPYTGQNGRKSDDDEP